MDPFGLLFKLGNGDFHRTKNSISKYNAFAGHFNDSPTRARHREAGRKCSESERSAGLECKGNRNFLK